MNNGLLGIPSGAPKTAQYVEFGPFSAAVSQSILLGNPLSRDAVPAVALQCFIAELGYVVGDRAIPFGGAFAATGGGYTASFTRDGLRINMPGTNRVHNKGSSAIATITPANWRVFVGLIG